MQQGIVLFSRFITEDLFVQTLTHLAIGAAIGAVAFPHQPIVQLACVAASVGPDVVMMPLFALDKLQGRQPLTRQGPIVLTLKELSHSVFLCGACGLIGTLLMLPIVTAFALGWLVHIVIDILTHADPKFQAVGDPNYIWPLGSLRRFGVWEYRIATGQLWPLKPFELLVLIAACGIAVLGWVIR